MGQTQDFQTSSVKPKVSADFFSLLFSVFVRTLGTKSARDHGLAALLAADTWALMSFASL